MSERKDNQRNRKFYEPKISELEKWLESFRIVHGHEKLKESIREATRDSFKNPHPKSSEHTVYNSRKAKGREVKIVSTKEVMKDLKNSLLNVFIFTKGKMKHKRYRYPSIAIVVFLGIYLLFNLPLIYNRINWKGSEDTQKLIVKTEEVVQKDMADSAALAPGEVIPTESRILVPKINVNAPIVYADTTDEKAIEDMLHNGVVHYYGTANPGEVGNSFITGHSSNYWWDTGKYNYVFTPLDKLEAGDQAIVYYNNKKFVYTMRDKTVVEGTDMSVLAPSNTPVLSLMTCTPPGTSWKRLVVRLDLTDPVYHAPETVTKEKVIETPVKKEKGFVEKFLSIFIPN